MSQVAEQEVIEVEESLETTNVSFEHYFRHIVELDKTRYEEIFANPIERAQFQKCSIEDRLKFFSNEFQVEVKSLYQNQIAYKIAKHALAKNVYRLGKITNRSYKEIAQTLEAAFSKQLSRSHICKLYRTGELLSLVPALSIVQDVEKLATLSRVPVAKISQMLTQTDEGVVRVANLDIGKASRAQVQELVKQEAPTPSRTIYAKQIQQTSSIWTLDLLRSQLNDSLAQVSQSDLSAAIVECIRIIDLTNK